MGQRGVLKVPLVPVWQYLDIVDPPLLCVDNYPGESPSTDPFVPNVDNREVYAANMDILRRVRDPEPRWPRLEPVRRGRCGSRRPERCVPHAEIAGARDQLLDIL